MSAVRKFLPSLFSAAILSLVIRQVQPPESLAAASHIQLLAFFLPLLLFLTFSINLYFKFPLKSLGIAMGPIALLVLQSLEMLNILSGAIVTAAAVFLIKSLKKPKNDYQPKIPKLSQLSKQR